MIRSASAREGGAPVRLYSGAGARAAAEPQHVRMVLVTVQNIRNKCPFLERKEPYPYGYPIAILINITNYQRVKESGGTVAI